MSDQTVLKSVVVKLKNNEIIEWKLMARNWAINSKHILFTGIVDVSVKYMDY